MSTRVRISDVTKKFGDFTANNNVNIDIKEGEFVSLLGPSGCGKTTLLSMILGILEPTEGNIYFGDNKIDDVPIHKRDVGMVFQNYALFPHMTIFDNVAFGLKMRKMSKEDIKTKVKEALEMVHLEDLGHRYPGELSGGQQQRVAFARAIVVKPKVLLLDEPLSNLDAKLREEMRFELKKLHKKLGITTIYVTHDQIEALSLSTKIAVLKSGVVQQYGTPLNIFLNPKNPFVANFVGYSNFFMCEIKEAEGDNYKVKDLKNGYEFNVDMKGKKGSGEFQVGDKVTLTTKSEGIKILDPSIKTEGENIIEVSVVESDYNGTTTRYELITNDDVKINASEIGYSDFETGSKMKVFFQANKFAMIKCEEESKEVREEV